MNMLTIINGGGQKPNEIIPLLLFDEKKKAV
ncbi:hypothetical protein Barb6_02075 [Bacteroidales bacterium Barb6]|nr:hypothetical protein Barb6_02075 [Bacteroidales bacterium Barb6]